MAASILGIMMRNETYAGRLHQFHEYRVEPNAKLKSMTKKKKSSTAIRPKEEWVTVSVPALISPELFEAVQKKLTQNRDLARRNTKGEYLLSGILYCSLCKGRLGGHSIHGTPYYRCYRCYNPDDVPLGPGGKSMLCQCP